MLGGRQGAKLVLASSYECSVHELAAFFTEQALPAPLKPDSRKEYVVGECHAPQLESERIQKSTCVRTDCHKLRSAKAELILQ